jgi:hypothetical protein
MRTRRRSHHIAAEIIEEPLDDTLNAGKPQAKRQRRLTAHQRGTNAQVGGLKQQLQAPKAATVAAVPAVKNVSDVCIGPKAEAEPAPPVFRHIFNQSSSSIDSEEEEDPSYHHSGYLSSGSSRKMAPGKRIKWRSAISEGDTIRQDLSLAFLFASLNNSAGENPAAAPEQVCEPPYQFQSIATAVRSKRR